VDRLDPPDRVGAQVDVLEQPGQPDRAALGEAVQGVRVGLRQVERARPPVLVVQQRVPATQVGQGLDPLLLGGPDEFLTPTAIILGHAGPPRDERVGMRLPRPRRSMLHNELITGTQVGFGRAWCRKMIVCARMYAHT
jgi:hypothetical protein